MIKLLNLAGQCQKGMPRREVTAVSLDLSRFADTLLGRCSMRHHRVIRTRART